MTRIERIEPESELSFRTGNGTTPSPGGVGQQQAKESELRPKDGKSSIVLLPGSKEVVLPVNVLELLKDAVLEISKNNVVVQIPPKLLEELSKALGITSESGARIALSVDVLTGNEAEGILQEGAGASDLVDIRSAGEAVRLELSAVMPDGTKSAYPNFAQPIKLSLKFDDSRKGTATRAESVQILVNVLGDM